MGSISKVRVIRRSSKDEKQCSLKHHTEETSHG